MTDLFELGRGLALVVACGYFYLATLTWRIARHLYRPAARPWMYAVVVACLIFAVWQTGLAVLDLRPTPALRIFSRALHLPLIVALTGGFLFMRKHAVGVNGRDSA